MKNQFNKKKLQHGLASSFRVMALSGVKAQHALVAFFCFSFPTLLLAEDPTESANEFSLGIPDVPKMPNKVEIQQDYGWVEYNAEKQLLEYRNDFYLRSDTGLELWSDDAFMDLRLQRIDLVGQVQIFQNGIYQQGDKATYFYDKKEVETEGLKVSLAPILLEAGKFQTKKKHGKTYFFGKNAGITTHDVEKPNFWVRADEIEVYPGEKIKLKDLKLYVKDTPIFWLPSFNQSLNQELGYHFTLGGRSNWGAFMFNRYGMFLDEDRGGDSGLKKEEPHWYAQWGFDVRTRRGLGFAANLRDYRLKKNPNLTGLELYYMNDFAPQISRSGRPRPSVNEDRYKIALKHRHTFYQGVLGKTYADVNLTWLGDAFYREDLEPELFRIEPQPDNTLSLLHRTPRFLAGISTRLRLNHFYQADTKLPEIFIDVVKSPLGNSPVLYESHSSIGNYKEYWGHERLEALNQELTGLSQGDSRIDEITGLLDKRGYQRFHTYHELSLPFRPRRGVSFIPHVGAGYTRYWDNANGIEDFDRTHLHAGFDFSLKFSKNYGDVVNKKWGIDGLIHHFQPYINYSYLTTNRRDPSFRSIERLTPTTEIRPIRVGRFSAVDDLESWSIVRLGYHNSLMTQRDGKSHPWWTTGAHVDFFIKDPEFDRDFSNLYYASSWNPLPWVKLDTHVQFPIGNDRESFTEYAASSTFMPSKNTEIELGYRYLDSHPTLEDSVQIDLRAYQRFNEKWGLSLYQRWELDDGTLEAQQYSLHRDWGSWTGSIGFLHRNNRIKNEKGLMLTFTLKEFPSISFPFSMDTE